MKAWAAFILLLAFYQLHANESSMTIENTTLEKIMLAKIGSIIELKGDLFTKVGGFGPTYSLLQLIKSHNLSDNVSTFPRTFMVYQMKIIHRLTKGSWSVKIEDPKLVIPLNKRELIHTVSDTIYRGGKILITQSVLMNEKYKIYDEMDKRAAHKKVSDYLHSIKARSRDYYKIRDAQIAAASLIDPVITKKLTGCPYLLEKKERCMHPLLLGNTRRKLSQKEKRYETTIRKRDTQCLIPVKKQEN